MRDRGCLVRGVSHSVNRSLLAGSSRKTAKTSANLAFVFGKIVADVVDLEGAEDQSVRLAFEQKAKALFDQALCTCFAASKAVDIVRPGGNAVARRPSGSYFDFVNVALRFHHAKGWLWKHAASIDYETREPNISQSLVADYGRSVDL
jgi:hypothetical protein